MSSLMTFLSLATTGTFDTQKPMDLANGGRSLHLSKTLAVNETFIVMFWEFVFRHALIEHAFCFGDPFVWKLRGPDSGPLQPRETFMLSVMAEREGVGGVEGRSRGARR